MYNDIKKEMDYLLYNFWVTKDENPEMYYQIKNKQHKIKDFVIKNLGSNLIIHPRFIKLEKVSSIVKENNGISGFTSIYEYVFLSIFLIYLEDKTRSDIFILSDLVEYIKNTAITLELDHIPNWNLAQHRRSLINVINFLKEINVIKLKDEEKISFADNKDAEALYEVTGISNYVMRLFDNEINTSITPEDFLKNEFIHQSEEKGDARRYKVFRNLLYTPSISYKDLSNFEIDYIKKNRNYIKNELEKNMDLEVEITNNNALVYEEMESNHKNNFPNTKKISEIVLMVNNTILQDIKNKILILDDYEIINTKTSYLETVIKFVKEEKKPYIGKTHENLTFEKFYKEVSDFMIEYGFISIEEDNLIIYPSIARMIGITQDVSKNTQMDLFGGEQ